MKSIKYSLIIFLFIIGMVVSTQNDVLAATAAVDTSEVHQTMEGFGASVAYEVWQLSTHSEKGEVYNYLFKELGLDILRLRNVYDRNDDYIFGLYEEIVDSFYSKSENEPKILISSWSPPADLKSNGELGNGGTLDSTWSGEFLYGDFAQYWVDALDSFATVDIVPDYISIQNEPTFTASWSSCRFAPTETDTLAGYDQALDSVYNRLQELASPPEFLAAEVHGIGYNTFQNFANQFNHPEYIYGHAYHLYHGGDGNVNPDAFNGNLSAIASGYSSKPIFQTEYDYGGWFNTGWLMHNCLVHGNVSGYFYWAAVWSGTGGNPLIRLNSSSIYTIEQVYWVFRQYSKAIHYGWKRIDATIDADSLRISAFIDPAGNELSTIILNVSHSADYVDIDFGGFNMLGANMIRTSDGESCDYIGDYNGSTVDLPARSITTISTLALTGVVGIEEENYDSPAAVSLSQNYPNPFSTATTIEYSIAEAGFVKLSIYDISGREVETLVEEFKPAGKYTFTFKVNDLSPGVYFYKLSSDGNSIQRKMLLLK
jgi:glucuronoarabinoxylan endo-1,4-beta-xylanase